MDNLHNIFLYTDIPCGSAGPEESSGPAGPDPGAELSYPL